MAPTRHKSQLHCSGVMQWWACSSLVSTPSSADSNVTKLASALFYCCSLLRNNKMATNLQRFTSSYDSSCAFPHVTVDLRHLWQVMQRYSDSLA